MHKTLAAATLTAAAVIAPTAALAEPTARVEYRDSFTTRTPGAASGRLFHDEFFDARDAGAKPPAVQHFHFELPKGARFDTSAVPACGATDAQLMAQGAAACQSGSQVGTEVFSFDTGADGSNRLVTSDITFLNDPGQMIILTQERQTGTRVVVRATIGTDTEDFDITPLPGTPPEGGADKLEDGTYPVSTGPGGRAWLTTPPTCPASGVWTFRAEYTFRNGERVTKTSDSPCDRPKAHAPKQPRLTFFHRQHGHAMRVRASKATVAQLRIFRGAKRLVKQNVALEAGLNRVRLPRLRHGTYRLTFGGREAILVI
jgi:hypothetical protein